MVGEGRAKEEKGGGAFVFEEDDSLCPENYLIPVFL